MIKIAWCKILVIKWMKDSCDSKAIEISECRVGNDITEIYWDEGKSPWNACSIGPAFILYRNRPRLFKKKPRLNVFYDNKATLLSILEYEKHIQIIISFVPISFDTELILQYLKLSIWKSPFVIMNLYFVPCIYVRKPGSRLWLEELQELSWEANHLSILIVIQVMRNIFEIDFPEQEMFMQNAFDSSLANIKNESNPFLSNI
jgi:hypothetical protein